MLLERAEMIAKEGSEDAFDAALADRGVAILRAVPGVKSVQCGRGVENPDKFMLLVEWDAMDAHVAFTKSAAFGAFRELVMPFSKGGAMEHFSIR